MSLKFAITGDNKNVLDAFKGVQQGVRQTQNVVERSGKSIDDLFTRIKESAVGGFKQIAAGLTGLAALVESGNFIKTLYDDMGKFSKAMKEVSTLSKDVAQNFGEYKKKVVEMTTQIAIGPEEAAKALYQIESAGHHGADGLNVLEQAAKGAIGGVTETATAADAITTILNSYKMSASEAAHINDLLFTTVRLGKTTYGELGSMIAQVTPIAASYGVAIEDVLSAIASLTKSGTKTGIAIRQVRDAITAATNSLGDGAFKTRTFLEAMEEVAEKTKGSESALKQDLNKLSAMNAVLALTGKNAASAKQDFEEMKNSAGAATEAYEIMANTSGDATTRLRNNIFAFFMPLGDEIRSMGKSIADSLNEGFDDGSLQEYIKTFEAFIAAYALYRGMVASVNLGHGIQAATTSAAYDTEIAQLQTLVAVKEEEVKSDLDLAVAEGRLTSEKAATIAALRAEAQAHLQNLQAMAAEAQAAFNESTSLSANIALRLEEAEAAVAAAEQKYAAAVASGNATTMETAELELNTAVATRNAMAKELEAAREEAAIAAKKMHATATAAETAATVIDTSAQAANTTSTGVLAAGKLALKKAIDAVNASFLASPLFWMAATIVGVTYVVYNLITAETAHEAAVRKSNEAIKEQDELLQKRKDEVEKLIRTLQDQNATEYDRVKAYNRLKQIAPQITDEYSRQALEAQAAADSQKNMNKILNDMDYEDAKKKVEEYTKQVEEMQKLYDKYQKMSKDGVDVSMAPDFVNEAQLQTAYKMLDAYEKRLKQIEDDMKQAAEEARPIEIRIKEAEDNIEAKKSIYEFYEKAMALAHDLQDGNDRINYATGLSSLEEFIQTSQKELEDLRKKIEDNPMDVRLQLEYQEKQKILNYIIDMKNEAVQNGYTIIPFSFELDYNSFVNAWNRAKSLLDRLKGQTAEGGATTLQQDYSSAKKAYEDAQRQVNQIAANRSKYTSEQWNTAQANLRTAKDKYSSLGGDVSTKKGGTGTHKTKKTGKTGKTSTWNQAHANMDADEMMEEWKKDMIDLIADIRQDIADANIDILDESKEKTLAKLKEDEKKELDAIKEQRESLIKERKELDKKLWEKKAEKNDKYNYKVKADEEYLEMIEKDAPGLIAALEERSKQITESFAKQREEATKEYIKQEKEAMISYLKEYGDIEQQKLAITQEYEEKIAEARKSGASPYEIASLELSRDKQLRDIDTNALNGGVDWSGIFSSLEGHTKQYLEGLKIQLQGLLDSGNLPIDEMATIQEKLREVNEAISEQSTMLDFVGERTREYNRLQQASADAQDELARALKEQTQAEVNLSLIKEGVKSGKYSEKDVLVAEGKLNEARKKTAAATIKAKHAEDAAAEDSADKIARKFADAAEWVNTYLGDVPELLGKLGLGGASDKAQMGLDAVNDAAGAAADFATGNYIGAAMKAFSALDNLGNIVGVGGMSDPTLEADIERLTQSNENLQKAIEALADQLEDASVLDIKDIYEQQKRMLEQTASQTREMMSRSGAAYNKGFWGTGIGGSGSSNKKIGEAMSASDWAMVSKAAGKTVRDAASFWNLSSKEMYQVMRDANAQWTVIMDKANDGTADAAKFMNDYIELWKKQEELENAYKERWTNVSFDSVKDSFLSALSDMDKSASDFSNDFTKYLFDAVMNAKVGDMLEKELSAWYDKFAKYMETGAGELTEAEIAALRSQWNEIVNEGIAMRNAISSATGYTGSSSEESATYGAVKSFTQEQGDILNGRLTAIQINTATGNVLRQQIMNNLNALNSIVSVSNAAVAEIRNMMIYTNSYLEDVARYAKRTYEDFGEKIDKIVLHTQNL